MAARRVTVVVSFAADMPDDEFAGDAHADAPSDAIVYAVNGLRDLGVYDGSAQIEDWSDVSD